MQAIGEVIRRWAARVGASSTDGASPIGVVIDRCGFAIGMFPPDAASPMGKCPQVGVAPSTRCQLHATAVFAYKLIGVLQLIRRQGLRLIRLPAAC